MINEAIFECMVNNDVWYLEYWFNKAFPVDYILECRYGCYKR